jgi:mannose-1-phosphate guanylyltransferase
MPIFGRENILVITVSDHSNEIRKELNFLPENNFLPEPQGKNTAPCIGLAAVWLTARDPSAIMTVIPADHWISDLNSFRQNLKAALQVVQSHDELVTIGIRPSYPETGYGYISKGKAIQLPCGRSVYRVKGFQEKPTSGKAARLMRSGSLWNSGIFTWRAFTILTMLERFNPRIHRGLERIRESIGPGGIGMLGSKARAVLKREYRKMPNLSIDHAVLEKAGSTGNVLTMEADFEWSDVGNWEALYRMLPHDQEGNAGIGKWLGVDSRDCLIHSSDRLVVLLGMREAMVVDSPDVLLVGDIKRAQHVRDLVKKLQLKGYGRYVVR